MLVINHFKAIVKVIQWLILSQVAIFTVFFAERDRIVSKKMSSYFYKENC